MESTLASIYQTVSNPFFPDLVKCFERMAVEHGQEVVIADTDYQPPLTTIRLSRAEIATRAFTALYAASQRLNERGILYQVRTELVVRSSTSSMRNSH